MEYRNILPLLVAFSIHQVLLDCCVVCQIFLAASKIEVVSAIYIQVRQLLHVHFFHFYRYTVT